MKTLLLFFIMVILCMYVSLYIVAFLDYKIEVNKINIQLIFKTPMMFYMNNKYIIRNIKKKNRDLYYPKKVLFFFMLELMMKTFHYFVPIYFCTIKEVVPCEKRKNCKDRKKELSEIRTYWNKMEGKLSVA